MVADKNAKLMNELAHHHSSAACVVSLHSNDFRHSMHNAAAGHIETMMEYSSKNQRCECFEFDEHILP